MTNYSNINELWEKNLENVNTFTEAMKEETTKAMQRQTKVITESVSMGVELTNNIVSEVNKNILAAGEIWTDAMGKAFRPSEEE